MVRSHREGKDASAKSSRRRAPEATRPVAAGDVLSIALEPLESRELLSAATSSSGVLAPPQQPSGGDIFASLTGFRVDAHVYDVHAMTPDALRAQLAQGEPTDTRTEFLAGDTRPMHDFFARYTPDAAPVSATLPLERPQVDFFVGRGFVAVEVHGADTQAGDDADATSAAGCTDGDASAAAPASGSSGASNIQTSASSAGAGSINCGTMPVSASGASSSSTPGGAASQSGSPVDASPPAGSFSRPKPAHATADDSHASTGANQATPQSAPAVLNSLPPAIAAEPVAAASTVETNSGVAASDLVGAASTSTRGLTALSGLSTAQTLSRVFSTTLFSATELATTPTQTVQAPMSKMPAIVQAVQQIQSQLPRLAHDAMFALGAVRLDAPAAPIVGRVVYNLIHLDALALFNDGADAFINESSSILRPTSPGRLRAWVITSAVVAADAVLIAYLLRTRRDNEKSAPVPELALARNLSGRKLRRASATPADREFSAD